MTTTILNPISKAAASSGQPAEAIELVHGREEGASGLAYATWCAGKA